MPKGERQKLNLERAEALDDMDKSLSTDNADFLERVLKALKEGKSIGSKDESKLEALHKKYFPEDDEEEEEGKEDDEEKGNDDDDIDEDDFV